MDELNQQSIRYCLTRLKQAIRSKGITYKDISLVLNLSEVTVKRLFNQTDISFSRLLMLSELAGLPLAPLLHGAQNIPSKHYIFNSKQDNAFFNYPHLFHYFECLFYQKLTPKKIAEIYSLDTVSTHLYLSALENLELIECQHSDKFNFKVSAPLGFGPDSLMLKKQVCEMIENIVHAVLNDKKGNCFTLIKPLSLREETYQKMLEEVSAIVDKYSEISEQNGSSNERCLEQQIVFASHQVDQNDIERIDENAIINIKSGDLSV